MDKKLNPQEGRLSCDKEEFSLYKASWTPEYKNSGV